MIKIEVHSNVKQASASFARFADSVRNKVITRTLNKVAQQGRTQAGREIKDYYKIGTRFITRYITIQRAKGNTLKAVITAEGKPLPLVAFSARQTKQGVQVKIKGRTITIPHAFIAQLKSGHRGVFARGGYKGGFVRTGKSFGRFAFGKMRLPVNELFTFSIPQGFSNKIVLDKVVNRINEQFPKVLAQEINYLLPKT